MSKRGGSEKGRKPKETRLMAAASAAAEDDPTAAAAAAAAAAATADAAATAAAAAAAAAVAAAAAAAASTAAAAAAAAAPEPAPTPGVTFADSNSVTINGVTITLADIVKFAPVVTLHRDENYLPCSIEYLVANCSITKEDDSVFNPTPTLKDLAAVGEPEFLIANPGADPKKFNLSINSAAFGGLPVNPANKRVQAPMYVCPQVPPDGSFVDLSFHFLYCYNGSQTARAAAPLLSEFDCSLPNYAEHQGDVELMTVRVSVVDKKTLSKIIFVRYNAHGDPTYDTPEHGMEKVSFAHQHPVGRSAYHSHASYNGFGMEDIGRIELASYSTNLAVFGKVGVDFLDLVDRFPIPTGPNPPPTAGPLWQPFDVDANNQEIPNGQLVLVGLDQNNKSINDQTWVLFPGSLGVQGQHNNYVGAQGIASEGTTQRQLDFANQVQAAAKLFDLIPEKYKTNNGPDGFSNRDTMKCTVPVSNDVPMALGYVWSQDHLIPNNYKAIGVSATPAAVVFKDKLLVMHEGRGESGWMWCSTFNGQDWDNDRLVPDNDHAYGTTRNPALAVYKDTLYIVHESRNASGWLWCGSSSDGVNFQRDWPIPSSRNQYGTSGPPALCVFNDLLYLVRRDRGNSPRLPMATFDGRSWTNRGYLPFKSNSPPSLVVFDDKLWCFTEIDGGKPCYSFMYADGVWSPQTAIAEATLGTTGTPVGIVFDGKLFVLREHSGGQGYLVGSVYNGDGTWSADSPLPPRSTNGMSGPPSLAVYNGVLFNFRQGRANTGYVWASTAAKPV